ncbi:hypothetical protein [Cronobacter sakazakii]|uniref:hypothetical protein n=1 Tax=Cronobacter sakazakii TaxID=28141 RepID=UPI000CFC9C1D|nr:hypothetical protein [Cronobacter sakazakii]
MMEVRFLIHISIEDILQKRAVLAGNNNEERDEEMLTRLSVQVMCEKTRRQRVFNGIRNGTEDLR